MLLQVCPAAAHLQAVAGTEWESVMSVVPSVAKGKQIDPPVVGAQVT